MGNLINRIPRQASRCQQAFSKPCLVNLISKDTHLVFSIILVLLILDLYFFENTVGLDQLASDEAIS